MDGNLKLIGCWRHLYERLEGDIQNLDFWLGFVQSQTRPGQFLAQ